MHAPAPSATKKEKRHRRRLSKPNPYLATPKTTGNSTKNPRSPFIALIKTKASSSKNWSSVSSFWSLRDSTNTNDEAKGKDAGRRKLRRVTVSIAEPLAEHHSSNTVNGSPSVPLDVLKWGRILDIGDTALVKLTLQHIHPQDPLSGVGCIVAWRQNYRNHRLHLIQFHDGNQLIVCVPVKGQLRFWTQEDEECLRTEAQTMRYIGQRTDVPVAHVYGFDGGFDNEIGAPYILLQRLKGDLMCDAWHSVDPATNLTLEEKRDNMCRTLAEAMSGLHALSFPSIGRLDFGDSDSSIQITPKISTSHHRSRSCRNKRGRLSDLNPNGEITRRLPCRSSRTYFRSALSSRPAHRNSYDPSGPSYIAIGAVHVLRLVIDHMPRCEPDSLFTAPTREADKRLSWNSTTSWQLPKETTPETFVLAHPSGLAPQNLLFNDIGHLVGIVDWAGVTVVPRCIGYAALPVWLRTQWGEEEVSLVSSNGATPPQHPGGEVNENDPFGLCMSREEEERRRRLYTDAMRAALQRASGPAGTQEDNDARFTSQSLVYCAVESALRGDGDGEAIAKKILRLVLPDCEPCELLMALGEINEDARRVDERIRRGLEEWFAGQDEAWDELPAWDEVPVWDEVLVWDGFEVAP